MKKIVVPLIPLLLCLAGPAFGDSEEIDCHRPENVKFKIEAKKRYENMLSNDKAGKFKSAYEAALPLDSELAQRTEVTSSGL